MIYPGAARPPKRRGLAGAGPLLDHDVVGVLSQLIGLGHQVFSRDAVRATNQLV